MKYYKVAKTDGFDFHTGNTINYRENIGKIVECPNRNGEQLCSDEVIHASEHLFQALRYGELPCSIFEVEGSPVQIQSDKAGFKSFKVVREIPTKNWFNAYCDIMKYMLEDIKNNFDNKKHKQVTDSINQVIDVFTNGKKAGKFDESAWSARSAAWSAAWSARSAAESAVYKKLDAWMLKHLKELEEIK